jgi:ribonucleoside-diphosphate reductase beta chain
MASLLELTSHGDVGTISDESKLSQVKLMSPQQLYESWEKQNWVSHTIGFETDTAQWQQLDEQTKGDIVWSLSSFFIGEERVTTSRRRLTS